jgi:molecular chaperone HtpG
MNSSLLEYPQLFREKLEGNKRLRSAVDSSLVVVADLLQVSKLPFFPDYTDHSTQHLASLLGVADKLIPDRTRALFTAEDTAVLILSVLLHDLALHLSEAGFMSLLNSTNEQHTLSAWAESWREFLTLAKHWDDRKLVDLFGADEAGAPRALVRNPLDHYDNLTESDRKLIGEFIRQNHAEFAYQFAVRGFPGHNGQLMQFGSFDPELKELAGLIARSHNFPLRDCVRLLEEKQFNKLEQDNVHPVFLMGVLRVADFLELGSERAPVIAFAYKEFKSPVSQKEWRTNQAFRKISWGNPDPESIHIPAKPTDVYSFLELTRWLTAIQSELDMTWAVFGEVYGAHPRLSGLGLAIRRVRSNITDDPQGFARNASFVPRRVELGVAGADVLKLFIEPLYGKHPEIGVRELMQNAVDAVRERWEFEKNHSHLMSSCSGAPQADVVVWLDDPDENGTALLTVCDNGIGMTEEVVANYFLKAGASFRRSIAWKKEFESEPSTTQKNKLKSRVLRSGRFGIGVLAAFLLGDEIEVLTRHVTSQRGIRFSMRLDLRPPALEIGPIQLSYDATLPIGTTVKVKVDKVARAKVEKKGRLTMILGNDIFSDPGLWDWYCLAAPSVARLQGRERKALKQSATVPAEDATAHRGWHTLLSSDYRTVHAKVDRTPGFYPPRLACNGMRVERKHHGGFLWDVDNTIDLDANLFPGQGIFRLRTPEFSVFDPDGNLPLNLQRTGLTSLRLDFLTEAFAAQTKAALAKFLLSAPVEQKLTDEFSKTLTEFFQFGQVVPMFFTKFGTAPLTATNLRLAKAKNCLLIDLDAFTQGWLAHLQDRYDAIMVAQWGDRGSSSIYSLNTLNSWIATARVITRSDKEPVVARPLRFRYKEFSVNGVQVYRTANCAPSLLKREEIEGIEDRVVAYQASRGPRKIIDFVAAELFLKPGPFPEPDLSVGYYWERIMREPVVAFNLAERRTRLEPAYEDLQEYLADYLDTPAAPH